MKYTILIRSIFSLYFFVNILSFGEALGESALPKGVFSEDSREEGFSVEQCVRYAVLNSFEAKLAKLDLLVADTGRTYAEAVYDVMFYGDAGYSRNKQRSRSVFGSGPGRSLSSSAGAKSRLITGADVSVSWIGERERSGGDLFFLDPAYSSSLVFQGAQPLTRNMFGYVDRKTITLADTAIARADLMMRENIEELIAEVEKKYWTSAYRKNLLHINKRMLKKAEKLHGSVSRNYKMGLAERPDILAAEANILIREKDVILAREEYRSSLENLRTLMNLEGDVLPVPVSGFSGEKDLPEKYLLIRDALLNNRMYHVIKKEVEMKGIELDIAKSGLWPELDLEGTFVLNGLGGDLASSVEKVFEGDGRHYYAGIRFSMPFRNLKASAEHRKAGYEKEKAVLRLKREERAVITRAGNAYRRFIVLDTAAAKMKKTVSIQAEKLEEEDRRFASGRSSTKRIIDYQEDLLRAEMMTASELFARETARVTLEKELNTLLEKYSEII